MVYGVKLDGIKSETIREELHLLKLNERLKVNKRINEGGKNTLKERQIQD